MHAAPPGLPASLPGRSKFQTGLTAATGPRNLNPGLSAGWCLVQCRHQRIDLAPGELEVLQAVDERALEIVFVAGLAGVEDRVVGQQEVMAGVHQHVMDQDVTVDDGGGQGVSGGLAGVSRKNPWVDLE